MVDGLDVGVTWSPSSNFSCRACGWIISN